MDKYQELSANLYFINNGEIDLLTGVMAPARFNQIVDRDLKLANRNLTQLSIICVNLNLAKFLESKFKVNTLTSQQLISEIESELVSISFGLKNTFRQTDCICRISQLGFWIFLVGRSASDADQLLDRVEHSLPIYLDLGISDRDEKWSQLDWYSQIDRLQFKS